MADLSEDTRLAEKRHFWTCAFWVSLLLVALPPLIGVAATVVGMRDAMGALGSSGGEEAETLANGMSLALLTTVGGLGISVLAFPFLIVAFIRYVKLRGEGAGEAER